ncbi:CDP-alcohol phosphatidyltransferase family protein [Porphyromonas levii]|uniref:CDP-alcohol phosphatidyltransferase family protein n=1 Tax=Porphyromonas levii TaxID=28114 RepID=A0A4Y8WR65_9PORP|nr:CDP-alcohol phosphatidyltransferase family protein [Porphyromonas levii]TFH96250.1 CDP-alcohol phosphatidyltransferase family protein [Porphyromonas levii]TFH97055.1 CDP-alcohol phosphatidyltransferase family protein [Porphyromonas levii]
MNKDRLERSEAYLSSLKSLETENYIDRVFYRPVGFRIAWSLRRSGITPNTITVISIVVGMMGAWLFYYESIGMILLGIAGLVAANILDCVDGQLARLTGIKSKIGRILDGMAGDLWFITLYIAISLRMYDTTGEWLFFVVAGLSMLSHLTQAALTDLYKTFHLWVIGGRNGKEFESYETVKAKVDAMPAGFSKFLSRIYSYYTLMQAKLSPRLQRLASRLEVSPFTDEESRGFRQGSMLIQKLINLMTFNGRTLALFASALVGLPWFYFVYEILFLNIVLLVSRAQHETLCKIYLEWLNHE